MTESRETFLNRIASLGIKPSEISGLVTNKDDLTAAPDYGDIDVLGTFTSTGITNTKGSTTTYERKDFSFS